MKRTVAQAAQVACPTIRNADTNVMKLLLSALALHLCELHRVERYGIDHLHGRSRARSTKRPQNIAYGFCVGHVRRFALCGRRRWGAASIEGDELPVSYAVQAGLW